jgi:hypothetical protein
MKLTFSPEPEIAARLEKLCKITGLSIDQLLNTLLDDQTEQIVDDGDTNGIQWLLSPFNYDTKEAALGVIAGYDAFVAELKAAGDRCYHDQAAPTRTKDGQWELVFKSTDPRGENFPFGNIHDDGANWWKEDDESDK